MDRRETGLFDWKQLRLWRFSSWADILSKLVVLVYILAAIGQANSYNTFAHTQYQTNLLGLFSQQPVYILDVSAQVAKVLIQGLVYFLVLKGVSLGLTMIVETDINYRDTQPKEDA